MRKDDVLLEERDLPEWSKPKTRCRLCGHSWLFHWLKAPHRCNDCKECPGFEAELEA